MHEVNSQMSYHEPENYRCPFCAFLCAKYAISKSIDIVYQNKLVAAFIAPGWYPNNRGHVLIIPNLHAENLYELPTSEGHAIMDATRLIALALKASYGCDGGFDVPT